MVADPRRRIVRLEYTGALVTTVNARARAEGFHPGAWIVWATCAGIVAFSTTDPFYLSLLVAAAWFVHANHRTGVAGARSFRIFLLTGLAALAIRTLLVLLGTVNVENVAYAALEGMRLATLLIVFGTFNSVTDPFGVVRLAPRRFHEPALAAALALSIVPRTIQMVGRVREAQELRGIRSSRLRSLPSLAVPVLATGMEEAVTLAESMDARGHGRGPRSRYRPQRWSAPAVAVAASAGVSAAVFAAAWLGGPGGSGLQPSTFPLEWPSADPLLLAAVALLAAPGFLQTGGP
jgi:energy-coupling factor transport system permease protein